jgi:hypothetical protein
MANYLTAAQVNELADAVVSGGLATEDAREDLLSNINHGHVASLPIRSAVLDQIKSDLNEPTASNTSWGRGAAEDLARERGAQAAPHVQAGRRFSTLISASRAFAFILTRDSVASEACMEDLRLALHQGKRIFVLEAHAPRPEHVPPQLTKFHTLPFTDDADIAASVEWIVWELRDQARANTKVVELTEDYVRGLSKWSLAIARMNSTLCQGRFRIDPVAPVENWGLAEGTGLMA